MAHESFCRTENASCANSGIKPKLADMAHCANFGIRPKLADMAHESLCRAENASCANFGIKPELAGHNQSCLVEFGFQNVPILAHKHTCT